MRAAAFAGLACSLAVGAGCLERAAGNAGDAAGSIPFGELFERATGRPARWALVGAVAIAAAAALLETACLRGLSPLLHGMLGGWEALLVPPLWLGALLALVCAFKRLRDGFREKDGTRQEEGGAQGNSEPGLAFPLCCAAMFACACAALMGMRMTPIAHAGEAGAALACEFATAGLVALAVALRRAPEPERIVVTEPVERIVVVNRPAPSAQDRCDALAERFDLTKRERQVLTLLVAGRTRVRIAEELGLSVSTVSSHVQHVYRKTGTHSSQELLDIMEGSAGGDGD